MKQSNYFQWLKIIMVSTCLISLPLGLGRAESKSENNSDSQEEIVFLEDFEPPGDGKPKNTGVGGSRNGLRCDAEEEAIRALMPQGNFGLTLQENPAIYLYLPQTSATQVVLAFQDEAGTQYARAFLPIETVNNIASVALPKDKMSLTPGKNYQWKISAICGEYLQPGDPTFTGWVQRVEATNISKELATKTTKEQISFFGQHGYWYDLLNAISVFSPDNLLRVLELRLDN